MNRAIFKEWTLCLLSSKHSKTTWLRITEEQEENILKTIDWIITVIIILAVYIWALGFARYNQEVKTVDTQIIGTIIK